MIHTMKKPYITPSTQAIAFQIEGMIAESFLKSNGIGKRQLSDEMEFDAADDWSDNGLAD